MIVRVAAVITVVAIIEVDFSLRREPQFQLSSWKRYVIPVTVRSVQIRGLRVCNLMAAR
jgi:hypothetical protein